MDQGDGEELSALFEDLEQQAAGMELAERDAELADRARGEYATVTFADRVHASIGRTVRLTLAGGVTVEGAVLDAGRDWMTVAGPGATGPWLLRLDAVATARGLSARSLPEPARPVTARLGFGAALHRLSEAAGGALRLHLASGMFGPGSAARIGADFVEIDTGGGEPVSLVPFAAIRAVRPG